MGTPFPAGPWVRTILFFRNPDSQWQNDIWFKGSGAVPPDSDVNAVAAAIDTALMGPFRNIMAATSNYLGNTTYVNNGTYTTSAETLQYQPGEAEGDPIPSEDAAIVRLDSGVGTRSGNGRIFVGGLATDMIEESRPSASGVTALTAIKTALIGIEELATVPCNVGVWSRKLAVLEKVKFISIASVLGHRTKRRPIH